MEKGMGLHRNKEVYKKRFWNVYIYINKNFGKLLFNIFCAAHNNEESGKGCSCVYSDDESK